jgi:glycosyltransferase involved in cell wall biosynthesis
MQYITAAAPFSVHASIMRSFDRDRVACHVAYNRRALDLNPFQAPGKSLLDTLESIPGVSLLPAEFGPQVAGASQGAVAAQAARSAFPALRDGIRLARHIHAQHIDVIHCAESARSVAYGFLLSRLTGAKIVVHLHAKYGDWINPLSRWAIRNADGVIAVSRWAGEEAQRYGISPERMFTVYNGVNTSIWDPAIVDRTTVRREFGLNDSTALLVSIAGLRPTKGQALLLKALHRVVQTQPDTRLLIVGTEDARLDSPRGSYTEELKRLAGELGLESHVVFTGGRSDIRDILAAADVFALPAFEETFGLAFLEAMAMAKPVIGISSGGVPEVVVHEETGFLSAPDDSEQLAENVVALLAAPERRHQMGAAGRRRAVEQFTLSHMANGVEQVYRTLLAA